MDKKEGTDLFQKETCVLINYFHEQLNKSETLRRFLKLASWTLVAFALDKAAMLIIVFLLARILGANDYGRLTLAQGLVTTAKIFVVLGAGTVLARHIPALREESAKRAVEVINLCALVVLSTATAFAIVAMIGGHWIAAEILDLAPSSPITYLLIFWVLLTALNSLMLTIMLSFENGRALGLVSLLAALLSIVTSPLFAFHLGLTGAITALVAVEVAKASLLLILHLQLLKSHGVAILTPVRRSDLSLLWKFGVPVFLTSALWAPTIWLAQLVIKVQAPDGLVAVGVFGLTNSILGAVILLSGLTNRAALPILSSLHARRAFSELGRTSRLMALGQLAAACVIGLPLGLAAPFIMAQAGPTFAAEWPVLVIMIVTGVIIAGQTALGNSLLVLNRPYFLLLTMILWSLIVLSVAVLYPHKGAYALSGGLLMAAIARTTLIYFGWKFSFESEKPS